MTKWKHYSTWAIILLPVFTLAMEQFKHVDLGEHGSWVVPTLSLIIGVCKIIPQVSKSIEAANDEQN